MTKITKVNGKAVPVSGNDIDTDRIIPARFLKEITFSKMGSYPFYDERFDNYGKEKSHPFNEMKHQGAHILIANENFGCGSSREHAAQALHRWGIQAVVGESFGEIFAGNCLMLGVPVVTAPAWAIAEMQALAEKESDLEFTLDLDTLRLSAGDKVWDVSLSESRKTALTQGYWDSTAVLLSNAAKTKEVAKQLGYA